MTVAVSRHHFPDGEFPDDQPITPIRIEVLRQPQRWWFSVWMGPKDAPLPAAAGHELTFRTILDGLLGIPGDDRAKGWIARIPDDFAPTVDAAELADEFKERSVAFHAHGAVEAVAVYGIRDGVVGADLRQGVGGFYGGASVDGRPIREHLRAFAERLAQESDLDTKIASCGCWVMSVELDKAQTDQ